jgi:hypothetical protein
MEVYMPPYLVLRKEKRFSMARFSTIKDAILPAAPVFGSNGYAI